MLEDDLGARLLERATRQAWLTEAGTALPDGTRPLLVQADRLASRKRRQRPWKAR